MKSHKSWRQKLEARRESKISDTEKGRMLIPTGQQVGALVREIPRGGLATINQLRERLARAAGADFT